MQSQIFFRGKKQISIILDLKFPNLKKTLYLCTDDDKEEHHIYHQPHFR